MEIGVIARTVEQNIQKGGTFLFSDATVGVPYMIRLFDAHMMQGTSFLLTGFSCSMENERFRMQGSGTFPDNTPCHLELIFFNDEKDILQVEMSGQNLIPAFSHLPLSCRCAYREDEEAWEVLFMDTDTLGLSELLAGAISFLGLSVSSDLFGKTGNILKLRFRYELPFAETGEMTCFLPEMYDYPDYNRKNYFLLSFETDLTLNLSAAFENGNKVALAVKSFLIEKFGDIYGFAFEGSIQIWDFLIPFTIRYDGQFWSLATVMDEKSVFTIPSVNRLGELVGISNLNLPDSFSNLTNFACESIILSVSSDFRQLNSFCVVVSNQNIWYLSRTPDIHITNLKAGFTKTVSGTEIFISGDFMLSDWKLILSAAYHGQNGWIFRCFLSNHAQIDRRDGEPANISEIFQKISAFLGFSDISFPLPDLKFKGAMISYDMTAKRFQTEMEIGDLQCRFDYTFAQKKQSWHVNLAFEQVFFLSSLPLVGSDLHLLDGVTIKDVNLDADEKGCVLNLNFAGKQMRLQLLGKKQEEAYAEYVDAGGDFLFLVRRERIYDSTAENSRKFRWFTLEKRFSVFTIHRIGIGFDGSKISLAFDAELVTNAFELSLDGLSITIAVSERTEVSFGLLGLTVGFYNPSLRISGGFRRSVSGQTSCYDGTLLIASKGFSILAVGSYSDNSFLAYGMFKTRMGGPPAFSITGLAVGFGYNKYFILPDITQVAEHPLMKAAVDPAFSAGQLISGLKNRITDMAGQNFLAAGIRFDSFGMASSFALLTVSFGQHLEVALLGISKVTVPPMVEKDPVAKAELALKVSFLPESGVFSAEAQLMSDSYILSRNCRLTGGFAFYLWFDGEHKGDFVITMGGYRKGYQKPAHYPDVPRLGFCWNVTSQLRLSGEMYFALTPSALCAGGRLDAVFEAGALRAWFSAYADFEIGWKPFYYDISIGVGLGFSIRLNFWLFSKTITMEMSADLHIWGPDFSGTAKIKWWIISFTISFGERGNRVDMIDWNEFKNSFLLSKESDNAEDKGVISISAAEGIIGKITRGKQEIEVLRADTARFNMESRIPLLAIILNGNTVAEAENGGDLGVLPMGENVQIASRLCLEITDGMQRIVSVREEAQQGTDSFFVEKITRNLPKAMWAKQKKQNRNAGESELTGDALSGINVSIRPKEYLRFPAKRLLTLDMLSDYEKTEKKYCFTPIWEMKIIGSDTDFNVFRKEAEKISEKVRTFGNEMSRFGFSFDFKITLSVMAENADSLFDEAFLLGRN